MAPTSGQANTTSAEALQASPNIVTVDMMGLLAMLLKSQAETTRLQQLALEREIARDEKADAKEKDAAEKLERLRKNALESLGMKLKNDAKRHATCAHVDQKGGSTLWPISNYPDHRVRGTCSQCGIFIQPEHYEEDANGKRTLIPEHPLYQQIVVRDQQIYAGVPAFTSY